MAFLQGTPLALNILALCASCSLSDRELWPLPSLKRAVVRSDIADLDAGTWSEMFITCVSSHRDPALTTIVIESQPNSLPLFHSWPASISMQPELETAGSVAARRVSLLMMCVISHPEQHSKPDEREGYVRDSGPTCTNKHRRAPRCRKGDVQKHLRSV